MEMDNSQWQSLLKLGNECFHDKQWNQAEYFYSEAYDLLAYGYRNDPLSAHTLMAWICSCHNLSSLYEKVGNLELSLKFLTIPHEYLKEISESNMPNDDVKLIAFKGMSLTLPPILSFSKKYPICDDCVSKLASLEKLIAKDNSYVH